jgi:hypothetical protein
MRNYDYAWPAYNYGQLPPRAVFNQQYAAVVGDDDFHMNLRATDDADCFLRWTDQHTTVGNWDRDELYDVLRQLTRAFNDQGADCAGDLASSILHVLEIEWI